MIRTFKVFNTDNFNDVDAAILKSDKARRKIVKSFKNSRCAVNMYFGMANHIDKIVA